MIDVNKYIEIPYLSHGRDFNGCDCYGLVRLFLKNEFNKELIDFWDYTNPLDGQYIAKMIEENKPVIPSTKKDKPDIGDIVLYRFKGYVCHMGVYVGSGKILHILGKVNSCCVPMNEGILKGRIEGIYEVN